MKRANELWIAIAIPTTLAIGASYFAPTASHPYDYEGNSDTGKKVLSDRAGNIYVAVSGTSDSNGTDFVLVKYDAGLTFQWRRVYDGPAHGADEVTGLALDVAGNIYVSGTSAGIATGNNATGADVAVKAWLPNGQDKWSGSGFDNGAKRWSSGTGATPDFATDMAIDKNDNLYISGYIDGGTEGASRAFVVGVQSDGSLKSGWPVLFSGTGSPSTVFLAVDVHDDLSVLAGGSYAASISDDSDILVQHFAGGGSLIESFATDRDGGNDVAQDCAFGTNGRMFAAGIVQVGTANRFAVYGYSTGNNPLWSQELTDNSEAAALVVGDSFVFATGYSTLSGSTKSTTVKLEEADGDPSTEWASPSGIRYASHSRPSKGLAIWKAGTNVYVEGNLNHLGDIPAYAKYLTHGFSKNGAELIGEEFPVNNYVGDSASSWITCFCAGEVFATGLYRNTDTVGADAGTALYSRSATPSAAAMTIEVGTGTVDNSYIATSNDEYVVVAADYVTNENLYPVQFRFNGNVGTNRSELCFELETHAQFDGFFQYIDLWNYDSSAYEQVDARYILTSDRTLHIASKNDPDRYIDGSGNVLARVRYLPITAEFEAWTISVDRAGWKSLD